MVHGRYDMDCPPCTAYEVSQKLPNGSLSWVIGGHRVEHEMGTAIRAILLQLT